MTSRQFWPFGILVATTLWPLLSLTPLVGCRDASPGTVVAGGDVTPAGYQNVDAEAFLRSVFQRYGAAESYRDSARVRLSYDANGRRESQWAPLSVRLDRGNFYVEAYSLRCYCDASRTLSWIKDESTDNFDHQVSVRPAPTQRGDWEKLTLDPIFQQQLAAGLGGPPPQLDWLFAAEPMKRLFDDQHTFEFGSQQTIENRVCQSVIVRADARSYTFWIDRAAAIVREVELPSVFASPEPHLPPQEMSLTVQLNGATFQPAAEPPTIEPMPTRPHYVEAFVPLPPEQPNRLLGTSLDRKRLRAIASTSRPPFVSLLVCYREPSVSNATMDLLAYWYEQLPSEMRSRVRVLQVRPVAANQPNHDSMVDGDPEVWANEFGLISGGIAIVSTAGELAWTQPTLFSHELPALGVIVSDIINGVDVPQRLRDDWTTASDAYQAELKRRYREPR